MLSVSSVISPWPVPTMRLGVLAVGRFGVPDGAAAGHHGRMARPYQRRCRGPCGLSKPAKGGRRYRTQWGDFFLCADCDRQHLAPLRTAQMAAYKLAVEQLLAPVLPGQLDIQRRGFCS